MKRYLLSIFRALNLLLLSSMSALAVEGHREWQFRVLLDGAPIGTHKFALRDTDNSRLVRSEANFNVKFLFFTAFRYQHSNTETWSDGCLRDIDAVTVTNGKEQEVRGAKEEGRFIVNSDDERVALPECVMTFAYWNPAFLSESRLLNPQTGEYVEVDVEKLGSETLTVRSETTTAQRYRITTRDQDLEVWYSADNEWLALQSVAKGGRIIRYEFI